MVHADPAAGKVKSMTSMRLKDQPLSERPRERLALHGARVLTPAELVAILLRTGLKGTNVVQIGKELVQKYGSLVSLAQASLDDLQTIKGIGPDKAVTLAAAFELARKMAEELRTESAVLDTPEAVAFQRRPRAGEEHDGRRYFVPGAGAFISPFGASAKRWSLV